MKNIYIALTILLGSTFAPQQVQAAVITYDFTATVDDVRQITGPWASHSIFSSVGPNGGPTIAVGQTIAGRFSFENASTSIEMRVSEGWGTSYYDWSNGAISYTFLASNTTFDFSSGLVASWNYLAPAQIDNFIIRGDQSTLWFDDLSKTLFANGVPKGALALESLSKSELTGGWTRSDGALVLFYADLDTLTLAAPAVAEVPEPGSWGLLLAGLAAFGAAVRRKRC